MTAPAGPLALERRRVKNQLSTRRIGENHPLSENLDMFADYLAGLHRVFQSVPDLPPSAKDALRVLPDWAEFVSGMANRARSLRLENSP